MERAAQDVTVLLAEVTKGDQQAAAKLIPLVYDELRRLAGRYMRHERADHTLQATALVHEAYLKLVQDPSVDWQNRAHFFGIAAQVMRHILVDHARGHLREKRGGGQESVSFGQGPGIFSRDSPGIDEADESLDRLTAFDPRQGKIVELRFFGGLTVEETAEVLGHLPKNRQAGLEHS